MGLIIKNLKIAGDKGEAEVACLFDTGASESLIREDVAERVTTSVPLTHPLYFKMADGKIGLEAKKAGFLLITINGCEIFEPVLVTDKLSDEMLIGAEMMQRRKIKIDMEQEKITIDPKATRLRV